MLTLSYVMFPVMSGSSCCRSFSSLMSPIKSSMLCATRGSICKRWQSRSRSSEAKIQKGDCFLQNTDKNKCCWKLWVMPCARNLNCCAAAVSNRVTLTFTPLLPFVQTSWRSSIISSSIFLYSSISRIQVNIEQYLRLHSSNRGNRLFRDVP